MSRYETVLSRFHEMAEEINDRINHEIELNRKGYFKFKITDEKGQPVANKSVHFKHKKHEFKFGANLFMLDEIEDKEKNESYKNSFSDLFNLATLPFYWYSLEPKEGKPRYAKDSEKYYRRPSPDLCLEFCEKHGITPKAHCLLYDIFEPSWLKKDDIFEVRRQYERHFAEISERYRDRIPQFEVTNELLLNPVRKDPYPYSHSDAILSDAFKLAERYFPYNELILNEAGDPFYRHGFNYGRSNYYLMIEKALREGLRIDTVGIQFHAFRPKDDEAFYLDSLYNPDMLYRVLDQYAKLDRPLQITEITIPAYSESEEDEKTQAELLWWLYRIWFSHRSTEAIIYWNLIDGYAHVWDNDPEKIRASQGDMSRGENQYFGGLLRFDGSKKPAYYTLQNLIKNEWTTDEVRTSGEDGVLKFKGFYGDYDVEIDGVTYEISATKNRSLQVMEIKLKEKNNEA